MLWRALRRRGLELRFRRQHPVGRFILDFYAASYRLGVEVDGGVHDDEARRLRDVERDRELLSLYDIRIVRIEARLVEDNLPAAIEIIRVALRAP